LPLSIGIARDELPPGRVGVTVGLLSAIFGIGAGLGIVLAGPIVDHLSWHWLFWFPLMVIVLAMAGTAAGIPESPVRTPGRIDVLGALLLSAGLVALLLGINQGGQWGWSAGRTLALFAGAAVALFAWVVAELKVSHPLVDMRMLRIRGVWAPNVVGPAFGFVLFGSFLLIPQLLELPAATGYGFGKTVTQAGLFLLPLTAAQLVFGPISGILDSRLGARVPLLLGSILGVAAYVIPAISHAGNWLLLLSSALSGISIGLAQAAMTNATIESVPPSQTGIATSLNAIVRTIGGSLGSAVLAEILTSHAGPHGIPAEDAFTTGFWICAAVAAGGFLAALALPRHVTAPHAVQNSEPS
jgi:MFS family permease